MLKVAITGGLSCGKSSVCRFFQEQGAYVVSADKIVHQLLSPNTSLGKKVVNLLGPNIVKDGLLDRKAIAMLVFDNPDLLGALEDLVHPAVREEIQRRFEEVEKEKQYPLFVAEIPLLFESGMSCSYDYTIAVVADEASCRHRFSKLTGSDNEEFDKRMRRQWPPLKKSEAATFVIHNDGDFKQLQKHVKELFAHICSRPSISPS